MTTKLKPQMIATSAARRRVAGVQASGLPPDHEAPANHCAPYPVASLHDRSRRPAALQAVENHGRWSPQPTPLGFTPSAVSQQVKRLERQTGRGAAGARRPRGRSHRHGRRLVDEGARLLADLEASRPGCTAAGGVAGHLRIAAFSTAMRGLVARRPRPARRPPRPPRHPGRAASPGTPSTWSPSGQPTSASRHSWGDVPLRRPRHVVATGRPRRGGRRRPPRTPARRRLGDPARPRRRALGRDPRGHHLPPVAHPDVRRHRAPPRIAHVRMEFDSHLPWCERDSGSPSSRGWAAARSATGGGGRGPRPGAHPRRGRAAPPHDDSSPPPSSLPSRQWLYRSRNQRLNTIGTELFLATRF